MTEGEENIIKSVRKEEEGFEFLIKEEKKDNIGIQ